MADLKAPSGLQSRGRKFWADIAGSGVYDLSTSEMSLLTEVCRTLDNLDQLDEEIRRNGASVMGSAGQPVVNPALTEARGQRLALHRLIAALALPDVEGEAVPTAKSLRGKRAAQVRWAGHVKDRGA